MTKISNQYSLTNVLFADAVNGRVGIGTASPVSALQAVGAIRASNSGNTVSTRIESDGIYTSGSDMFVDGGTSNIRFYSTSERMRITSDGNVGIGTSSPLNVTTNRTSVTINGTSTSILSFGSGGVGKGYIFNDGTNLETYSAGALIYNTAGTERMRITSGGNVYIGTTSSLSGTAARIELLFGSGASFGINSKITLSEGVHINFINSSGTQVGYIYTTSSATTYATGSDYRLKEDLKEIKGIELLSKINFYNFKWKAEDSRTDGVIAHELQAVLPYAVTGVKDGSLTQAVDYGRLTPVIGRAVQELNNKIQEQQTQINELKALLNA